MKMLQTIFLVITIFGFFWLAEHSQNVSQTKYNKDYKNKISLSSSNKVKIPVSKTKPAVLFSSNIKPSPTVSPLNNAGNLRDKNGNFRMFKTKKEGYIALVDDINIKVLGKSPMMKAKFGKNYKPTIKNIISVYAPPNENNTKKYIKFISTRSKINENKVLNVSHIKKIIPHIIVMEKGHNNAKVFQQFTSN